MVYLAFFAGFLLIMYCISYTVLSAWQYFKSKVSKPSPTNYYIRHHLNRIKNDHDYDAYLKWLSDHDIDSAPMDKIESKEDVEFEKEVERVLGNKH